jgi:lysophospholipase L1-like esterase
MRFYHRPNMELFIPLAAHPAGGFTFRTDNLGLRRDTPVHLSKPPGVYRILVLGDSQTEGWVNNDEHFSAQLERLLNEGPTGPRFEVLNAGVSAYSPAHELLWYERHGARLQPDLVVLAFYPGNDLWDLMDQGVFVDGVDGTEPPLRAAVRRVQYWMFEHSRIYEAAFWATRPQPPAVPPAVEQFQAQCGGCWSQQVAQTVALRDRPADAERALRRWDGIVSRLAADVRAEGGRLAVVILPTKDRVEPEDDGDLLENGMRLLNLQEADAARAAAAIEQALSSARNAGATVLDPRDAVRDGATGDRLFYRLDWHLTPAGHRVVADALARVMNETQFIPW